jgi:hypothetical protein
MDLQCHLTTHSKPFQCSMCEETFHIEYLLDKHLQGAHAADLQGAVTAMSSPAQGQGHTPTKVKVEREEIAEAVKLARTMSESSPGQTTGTAGSNTSPGGYSLTIYINSTVRICILIYQNVPNVWVY